MEPRRDRGLGPQGDFWAIRFYTHPCAMQHTMPTRVRQALRGRGFPDVSPNEPPTDPNEHQARVAEGATGGANTSPVGDTTTESTHACGLQGLSFPVTARQTPRRHGCPDYQTPAKEPAQEEAPAKEMHDDASVEQRQKEEAETHANQTARRGNGARVGSNPYTWEPAPPITAAAKEAEAPAHLPAKERARWLDHGR